MDESQENVFVEKMPVISTAHAPSPEPYWAGLVVYDLGDYGWMVTALDNIQDPEDKCPDWFIPLLDWANEHGYTAIRFDSAYDEVDGLPTWNW